MISDGLTVWMTQGRRAMRIHVVRWTGCMRMNVRMRLRLRVTVAVDVAIAIGNGDSDRRRFERGDSVWWRG